MLAFLRQARSAGSALRGGRPKYLGTFAILFEIRLPLPGWVSILHRISGAALFAAVPGLLLLLDRSLASEQGFADVKGYATLPAVQVSLALVIWAYCHHFCAGIRLLFLDLHRGVDRATARLTSGLVSVGSLLITVLLAAKLW